MSKLNQPFDGNFVQLVREMEAARAALAALPDDAEWTQEGLATIDDLRYAALRLAAEVEATIEILQGKAKKGDRT